MSWKQLKWMGFAAIVGALSGCAEEDMTPAPDPVGISNPASDNCADLGGETVIETIAGGNQVGTCHLPDGRVCEEWALYRDGACEPAGTAANLETDEPSTAAAHSAEKRCGWYEMPTPGNLFLIDSEATWSITTQGEAAGPDATGLENLPPFDEQQYVEMNVPGTGYGYGCACMVVDTDAKSKRITRVHSGTIRPLRACRNDASLPDPV